MTIKKYKGFSNIELNKKLCPDYGNVDGLSLQNLFYVNNGVFPSCYLFDFEARTNGDYTFDTEKMAKYLIENLPENENIQISTYSTKILGNKDNQVDLGFSIILNKSQIYARFEKGVNDSYILYPNSSYEAVEKFVEMVMQFYVPPQGEENTFWRICSSQSGYYLEKGHSRCPSNFDVSKLYNDSFQKEDEKIRQFIEKEEQSGLVILHGEKGTGKSTYIKYIISKHPDKKFVFVPSALVNLLGDPSFGSFLTSLNNHIIILEDCENVITDRKATTSSYGAAVSLLLNMTDGILADDLNIKFICTFNEDMKNIDPALLRKGRCVSKYEFTPLCKEKATALLKERGIEPIDEKALTLSDIFHYTDDDYQLHRKNII